jgi:hypothetical protein
VALVSARKYGPKDARRRTGPATFYDCRGVELTVASGLRTHRLSPHQPGRDAGREGARELVAFLRDELSGAHTQGRDAYWRGYRLALRAAIAGAMAVARAARAPRKR